MARLTSTALIALSYLSIIGTPLPVYAATPLELTAQKNLQWDRDKKKITAFGDVKVKQGTTTLSCDQLTGDYTEGQNGDKFLIKTLQAHHNVTIQSPDGTVYGSQATYNVPASLATMTGDNLKMVANSVQITAADRFEYHIKQGELRALGQATVIQTTDQGQNILTADTLTATFLKDKNPSGRHELEKMEAIGNVTIKTPTETISGDQGIYNKQTNTAELSGHIKILRDNNVLEGEHATVDLNTNVSTLSGGEGRVKGVFYPQ